MKSRLVTLIVLFAVCFSFGHVNSAFATELRGSIATLTIPKIGLYSSVKYIPIETISGESQWVYAPWENQVGYFEGTAFFGEGNTLLGAHSTMPDGSEGLFFALDELTLGDEIIVMVDGLEQTYTVTQKFTVAPDEIEIAYQNYGVRLTLITCQLDNAAQRLVVVAEPAG